MKYFQPGDALLVADMQIDFCPGGALVVPEGDQVIPILNRWIHRAEDEGIPIFFSRDWHPVNHISFKARGGPWPPHCVQNTRGADFHPDLYTPSSAVVISKADTPDIDSYSAFGGTFLEEQLRKAHVGRLWVGGLALDYCVLQSVLDARKLGFEVHLIGDATRAVAINPGDAQRAVEQIAHSGAHVHRGELS